MQFSNEESRVQSVIMFFPYERRTLRDASQLVILRFKKSSARWFLFRICHFERALLLATYVANFVIGQPLDPRVKLYSVDHDMW
jgi:hypothetical protein